MTNQSNNVNLGSTRLNLAKRYVRLGLPKEVRHVIDYGSVIASHVTFARSKKNLGTNIFQWEL